MIPPQPSHLPITHHLTNMENTTLTEAELREEIVKAIKRVYDPEIPVDVYELGLIYDLENISRQQRVRIHDPYLPFLPFGGYPAGRSGATDPGGTGRKRCESGTYL